ncbi:MAG: thymidine kinase [Oligoflexia bacterium]|nr:thymidine kinase [Oligoflexia bacterium]
MAKLYFRYGAVSSAKTLNLLAVAHNYRQQGKKVLLVKPALDVRFGGQSIKSRAGLEQVADLAISDNGRIPLDALEGVSCVLVDEAQFLTTSVINQFRDIATLHEIPVICYGLRADFRSHLFEGSRRLLELADTIEEIKTTCAFCNKKAIMNLKHSDGRATIEGPTVDLGAEEKYFPACYSCYHAQLAAADAPVFPTSEQFELFTLQQLSKTNLR